MNFNCGQIYDLAVKSEIFYKDKTTVFPVKAGFYIFKNLKTIKQAAQDIEEDKKRILEEYKVTSEEEGYKIPKERIEEAQIRLNELCEVDMDLDLYPIYLRDIEDLKLTAQELDVLIPMIVEEEKEEEE